MATLKEMEKYLAELYGDAQQDLSKKWNEYMSKANKELKSLQDALNAAQSSGDPDEIKIAKYNLQKATREVTLMDDRYNAMVKQTAGRYADVNKIALNYVNGEMANIYTIHYNDAGNDIEKSVKGYAFDLVDENTVKKLANEDKIILPEKKLDPAKDVPWNVKQINSQVMQGILQGESIPDMAKRLQNVTNQNLSSSIRNARTMATSAENSGRLDSYKQASEDGVIMKKVWMAAHDDRTRESHADLDGEEVDVDEPFSNGLMYPGDPNGDPAEVYNCRCTMVTRIVGFKPIEQPEEEPEPELTEGTNAMVDLTGISILDDETKQTITDYSEKLNPSDIEKFNKIFREAEFKEGTGTYYNKDDNKIYLSEDGLHDYTIFHEGTHYHDYNQNYTIMDDWGRFQYKYDDDGNVVGKEWIPKIVTVKENASFSDYIAWEWNREKGDEPSKSTLDVRNMVSKLGTSDTYGPGRIEAADDMKAINNYLKSKNISKSDEDFSHLSDFISAITYDSNLGSLTTGGHDYNYWTRGDQMRVSEITAGYNVLKAKGREDLIDIERDLAPNLMDMIEEEWKKIW